VSVLSVAVACYNVESYLNKCLESFCDSRFDDRLQVIVVNDGSTDSTLSIAREYELAHPHIFKVIDKSNGGHGSAVNVAIKEATGKYFRIVDGDDWVNTEGMASLLDFLESAESDIVVDNKREVNMKTGETEFFPTPEGIETDREYAFTDVCLNESVFPFIMIHTSSVKTSILRENGIHLLEGVFYEDIEYVIKSTVRAETVIFKDLEVYQYLVGNDNQSVSLKNYVKRYSHHLAVTNELVRFAGEFQCEGKRREYLYNRVRLLINTNINICLLYNENRKEGRRLAKSFRDELRQKNEKLYSVTKKRYLSALALNLLGIDYTHLTKIKNLMRRS